MRARRAGDRAVVVVAVLALVAGSGCGFFDDEADETSDAAAPSEHLQIPDDLDDEAGCGEAARTEPDDLSAGRPVARCASESPAAVALDQPATVRVGIRRPSEDVAPILLAEHFDEFEAENLTVELTEYDTALELFEALDQGEVDVVAGELDGPFFDQVYEGSGARVALGGAVAPEAHDTDTAQAGLWLRTDLLDEPEDWLDLEDVELPVAVEDSIGDAVAYPVDSILEQGDMSLNELELVLEAGEPAAQALLDGDLSAAWLADPYWRALDDSELQIELVATLPAAESLGGVVFAERLLDAQADREVGLAFSRAVIRTINTYLADDYQDDEDVVAALMDLTGQSEADIVDTPALVFDWEIRQGTTDRIQQALLGLGGVMYEEALPEGRLVDRSVYEDVIAAGQG